jgi:hypothetical protein
MRTRPPFGFRGLTGAVPALLAIASAWSSPAAAQGHGGVAGSGMTDGGASITTRANVELSLESAPGTGAARVAAWGRAMGGRMPAIRACYEGVVADRPTVEGTLRMLMTLPEGRGGVRVEVSEDGVNDAPLVRCVRGVLDDVPTDDLHRPSGAYAVMSFSNTASRAAAASAVAAAEADAVTVSREGGVPSVSGEAREGMVRWVVRGAADASDELVSEAHRVVRSQIAGLLDCRRRASRRGMDPTGVLTFSLRLRGRTITPTVRESTVADTTAGRCVTQRLGRAPHHPAAAGTVELEVTFTP